MISAHKKVRIAYELTANDKLVKIVHSGKPSVYVHGRTTPEFPKAIAGELAGLNVGERKRIHLSAKQGYGTPDPKLVMVMPRSRFAQKYHFVGRQILSEKDNKYLAVVVEVRKSALVVDFNHPFAGKKLRYDVLVVGIEGEGMIPRQTLSKL